MGDGDDGDDDEDIFYWSGAVPSLASCMQNGDIDEQRLLQRHKLLNMIEKYHDHANDEDVAMMKYDGVSGLSQCARTLR